MKKIIFTFNGTKSQYLAYIESVKRTESERRRKQKMAAWFAKVEADRQREEVLSNK